MHDIFHFWLLNWFYTNASTIFSWKFIALFILISIRYLFICVCVYVCVCVCLHFCISRGWGRTNMPWLSCRGYRKMYRHWFSPTTLRVLGIELRSSELATNALPLSHFCCPLQFSFLLFFYIWSFTSVITWKNSNYLTRKNGEVHYRVSNSGNKKKTSWMQQGRMMKHK